MPRVEDVKKDDARRLAEAVREVAQLVRLVALVTDKVNPSVPRHELLATLDRRLSSLDAMLADVG